MSLRSKTGFTLAELLIALAILSVIAVFTITKDLVALQDAKYQAIGKEFAGMISGAYKAYKLANGYNPTMQVQDLTPYLNYVQVVTADSDPSWFSWG